MKTARIKTLASPSTSFRMTHFVAATIGLLACGTTLGLANDLANANLDATAVGPQSGITPTGWSVVATKAKSGAFQDGCSSETWCNVQGPDGYGLFLKPFQGSIGDEISVYFYQDLPATEGTKYTLSGYAAGEANFCAFFQTNTPAPVAVFAVEFLDAASTVIASNALDLVTAGLPNSGPGSMTLFTTPQYTAPANTATVRAGAFLLNGYSTTGSQSFFVDAFDLESEAPAGAPNISQQPVNTTVSPGSTATFTVTVSNPAGVTYQWQFNGTNISDGGNISGATTSTLSIANASATDATGRYRVRLTNPSGTTFSSEATLALTSINFFPVIIITGKIGDTYRVDYSTEIAPATWIPLSTNKLTTSPQMIIDTTSPLNNTRFYRTVLEP